MVSFEEIQAVYYMVAATGVLVAAVYYIFNLRSTRRMQELALRTQQQNVETRQIQLFNQFYDSFWSQRDMKDTFLELLDKWNWKDLNDFWQKYGPESNPAEWNKFITIFAKWEQMGLMVRDRLIDPKLIWHYAGSVPIQLWEKFEPTVIDYREKYEYPPKGMQWEWFEDLVYALKEVRERDRIDFQARLTRRKKQAKP